MVADSIGDENIAAVRTQVDELYEFLASHLIPHARAEDDALYPVVARLMGSPSATETMSRDHVAVVQLVDELSSVKRALAREAAIEPVADDLRRILYGLHALVKTHFAKEEEIFLPLLDERLTLDEATEMFAKMERSARHWKALLGSAAAQLTPAEYR
jgi:iron-sulfur cluster repair protein YtfE (RIC family)